jgi:uncharacterized protein (TIGR03437 family)
MTKPILRFAALCSIAAGLFAQSNTVVGSGYTAPTPISAAPGQILNLLVEGVGSKLTQRVTAPGTPLPTVLAGISVTLKQTRGTQSVPVPILAVRPISTCANGGASCGSYAAVTIQVPYELVANELGTEQVGNTAQFIVAENGAAGGAVDVNPLPYQVHVLNTCDINTGLPAGCSPAPIVTHADGSFVSMTKPAHTGEELVLYTFGLGATTPPIPTGTAAPPGSTTTGLFRFNFDFRANVAASEPPFFAFTCEAIRICPFDPLYAGLTAGYVGLYQANFVLPPVPDTMFLPCSSGVTSNLTVSLYSEDHVSFDGVGICVELGSGVAPVTNSSPSLELAPKRGAGGGLPGLALDSTTSAPQ